mgnify:CR=1 FL=1
MSVARSEYEAAWIEQGVVQDVNLTTYTCTVVTDDGKPLEDVQMMTPYFHPNTGEGIWALPEVGCIAVICHGSDNQPDYILGFIGGPELEGSARSSEPEVDAGQPVNESEEAQKGSVGSTGAGGSNKVASYRGGRDRVNPGTIALTGRDGNKILLHRGGVIEISATPMCQRIMVPVVNTIRDFAENYELQTPGGGLFWKVDRQEASSGTSAETLWRLSLRDKVNDKKASVQIQAGHVGSSVRYEVAVAPVGIDVDGGSVSTAMYKFQVKSSGGVVEDVMGKFEQSLTGGRDVTVALSDSLTVSGKRDVTVIGASTYDFMGPHMVKGLGLSSEDWVGIKTIKAVQVLIGASPMYSAVLGEELFIWLSEHIAKDHPQIPPANKPGIISKLKKALSNTVRVSI